MSKRTKIPQTSAPRRHKVWAIGIGECQEPGCTCANEHNPTEAFAYTSGFHERGMAELWLEALPRECSEMPVMLGYDIPETLDTIAREYSKGKLVPGEGARITNWPGGFTLNVTIERAYVERDEAQCFQAARDALVHPLTWCAHRG